MIKKLLVISLLLTGLSAYCAEVPVVITPVQKISTSNKKLQEGDIVEFKDIATQEVISATIREIKPNGFAGEQATLFINNFQYKNSNKQLNGELYIKGGEHLVAQEFANNSTLGATSAFIRGGEVILLPEKTEITVFFNDTAKPSETAIRITPAQIISTCNNEIEFGDKIKFKVVNDVYKNGTLYIKKDSPLIGIVDYVSDNGWSYDNAQIDFRQFKTKDVNGKIITINSPISINGFEILKYKGNRLAQLFNYCGVAFRGKEIEILPGKDEVYLNIWLK